MKKWRPIRHVAYPIRTIRSICLSIRPSRRSTCSTTRRGRRSRSGRTSSSNIPADGCASFITSLCKLIFVYYLLCVCLNFCSLLYMYRVCHEYFFLTEVIVRLYLSVTDYKQSPGYKFDVKKLISERFNSSFSISAVVSVKDVIELRFLMALTFWL